MSATSVPLKFSYGDTVRRAQFPLTEGYAHLLEVISKMYPTASKDMIVSYEDDDGDEIRVSSDGDLVAAFHCFQQGNVGKALRLTLTAGTDSVKDIPEPPEDMKTQNDVDDVSKGGRKTVENKPDLSLLHSSVQSRNNLPGRRESPSPPLEVSDEDGFELVKSMHETSLEEEGKPAEPHKVESPFVEPAAEEDGKPTLQTGDEKKDLEAIGDISFMEELPELSKTQIINLQYALFEQEVPLPPGEKVTISASTSKESTLATEEENGSTSEGVHSETVGKEFSKALPEKSPVAKVVEGEDEVSVKVSEDEVVKAAEDKKVATKKPLCDVPLQTTSGGALIYPDGTVEFGMGGDAVLLPDGQTVSCILSYKGFPSVAAKDLLLKSGKWYYEVTLLTSGLMQIGWCDASFTGDSNNGEGVGDDSHSYAYDGFRRKSWHNQSTANFGDRWNAGDVVCCAVDMDAGIIQYALNGQWKAGDEAFRVNFPNGLLPAASFSKGEKLCFNFGANGFIHAPPLLEYASVYSAYGTDANQFQSAGVRMPLSALYADNLQARAMPQTARPGSKLDESSATERLAELLLKEDVRNAISRFLGHPDVASSLQHVIVALLTDRRTVQMVAKAQLEVLTPLFLQLVSEQPELIGLLPAIMSMMSGMGNEPPVAELRPARHKPHRRVQRAHFRQGMDGMHDKHKKWRCRPAPFVAAMDKLYADPTLGSKPPITSKFGGPSASRQAAPMAPRTRCVAGTLKPAGRKVKVPDLVAAASAESQKPRCKFLSQTSFDVETGNTVNLSTCTPGQRIVHTWTMVNPVPASWPQGNIAKRIDGDKLIQTSDFRFTDEVLGHQKIFITVEAIAPKKPGRYIEYWRLENSAKELFGDRIWLDLTVV